MMQPPVLLMKQLDFSIKAKRSHEGEPCKRGWSSARTGCEPASGKKPASSAKEKTTVESVSSEIESLKQGKVGAREVNRLAKKLAGLTVSQLQQLKKQLGLRASGAKSELAKKIAGRALGGVGKPKQPTEKKPVEEKVESEGLFGKEFGPSNAKVKDPSDYVSLTGDEKKVLKEEYDKLRKERDSSASEDRSREIFKEMMLIDEKLRGEEKGERMAKVVPKVLGNLPLEVVASLVGAPDDAEIELNGFDFGGKPELLIKVNHPAFSTMKRTLVKDKQGRLILHNDVFFVKPEFRNSGIGSDVFARQVEQASKLGVSYIECHAGRSADPDKPMNGYYTWARFGYNQSLDSLENHDDSNKPVIAEARKLFPGVESVLDIMRTQEGRDWWKHNGVEMTEAVFDLTPGSRSLKVLQAYMQEREKKKSQGGKSLGWKSMPKPAGDTMDEFEEMPLNDMEEEAMNSAWQQLENDPSFSQSDEQQGMKSLRLKYRQKAMPRSHVYFFFDGSQWRWNESAHPPNPTIQPPGGWGSLQGQTYTWSADDEKWKGISTKSIFSPIPQPPQLKYLMKDKPHAGEPCKRGWSASRTGCVPKTPGAGKKPEKKPVEKKPSTDKKETVEEAKRSWTARDAETLTTVIEKVRQATTTRARDSLGVAGMRAIASHIGVTGASGMKKSQLAEAIAEKVGLGIKEAEKRNLSDRLERIALVELPPCSPDNPPPCGTGAKFKNRLVNAAIAASFNAKGPEYRQQYTEAMQDVSRNQENAVGIGTLRVMRDDMIREIKEGKNQAVLKDVLAHLSADGFGTLKPDEVNEFLDGTLQERLKEKPKEEGILPDELRLAPIRTRRKPVS